MKLIDLLVKELPQRGGWPNGCYAITQDSSKAINIYDSLDGLEINEHGFWCYLNSWVGHCITEKESPLLASDYDTAIITRAQYESALAASDGWIEWHGGECPVDSDAIVEVKYRIPKPYQYNNYNDRAGDFDWEHIGSNADIIAYRLHKPDAKSRANDDRMEQDLNECIGQGVAAEWDGDGLPPVGCECEVSVDGGNTWCSYKALNEKNGMRLVEIGNFTEDFQSNNWTLRPLRTEAEKLREKLAASLHIAAGASPIELNGIGALYFKLADAIISGNVFGTTFKAGK